MMELYLGKLLGLHRLLVIAPIGLPDPIRLLSIAICLVAILHPPTDLGYEVAVRSCLGVPVSFPSR